ncbi:MAG: hypothetical protein HC898_01995 [Phycisphaerales bacterium]|nr:hypothetical protein [Phycisphaerales bacterium]
MREQGFEVISAANLASAGSQLTNAVGVDVIAAQMGVEDLMTLLRQNKEDNRLAALPMVAVVDERDQNELNRRLVDTVRKPIVAVEGKADSLKAAVGVALSEASTLSAEETRELTLAAMTALRNLAVGGESLFNAVDAQNALIRCAEDKARSVTAAASVLSLLPTAEAQQALAMAALNTQNPAALR